MNQASQILAEVKKAVCGKDRVLVWVLTVILARGHILLEDIPGVGKTTMALAFSRALGLDSPVASWWSIHPRGALSRRGTTSSWAM